MLDPSVPTLAITINYIESAKDPRLSSALANARNNKAVVEKQDDPASATNSADSISINIPPIAEEQNDPVSTASATESPHPVATENKMNSPPINVKVNVNSNNAKKQDCAWLQPYIDFHKKSLLANKPSEDDKFCFTASIGKPDAYVSHACLPDRPGMCGGIGDWFKGIAATFCYAMCSNRTFFIHYDRPDPVHKHLVPNQIQWDALQKLPPNIKKQGMMEARNHDFCKNPSGLPKNQREIEMHSNCFPEDHLKKSKCYQNLTQQFPNSTSLSNDLSGAVLRALFRFSDRVNKKAEEMKGLAHMKDSKTAPHHVAIHLRTGTGLAGAVKEWKGPKRRELRRHGGNTFGKFLECACIVQREMADCLDANGTSTPSRRELRRGRGDPHIGGWRNAAAASGLPEIYIASDDARAKQTIWSFLTGFLNCW